MALALCSLTAANPQDQHAIRRQLANSAELSFKTQDRTAQMALALCSLTAANPQDQLAFNCKVPNYL